MKLSDTTKLPKKTSAKVNDPDNPAWTEDMLGEPVLKRVQQGQDEVLSSERVKKELGLKDPTQITEKENGQALQFPIANVPNEATAKSLLFPDEEKDYKRFDLLVHERFKDLDAEDLPIPKRMPARLINFDDT